MGSVFYDKIFGVAFFIDDIYPIPFIICSRKSAYFRGFGYPFVISSRNLMIGVIDLSEDIFS
jgi:hypothetical protein